MSRSRRSGTRAVRPPPAVERFPNVALAAALAYLVVGALAPRVGWAVDMLLAQDHEHWASFAFSDRHDVRFRAMTVGEQDGAMVALAFDRFPGGCDALYTSMLITLPLPAAQSLAVMDDAGLARVDALPLRPIRFNAVVREGGSLIVAEVGKVFGRGDFVAELRRGSTVRFKLGTEHRTYYVHFPLDGFTAATQRTLALCRASDQRSVTPRAAPVPRGAEDRDYFPE